MNEWVLYNYFRSSASHRVRIALNIKEILYEYRAVHLLNNGGEQHSEPYQKLNPSRQVPTLVHNGKTIAQSMAIIEYVDQVKPEPRLFPLDPYQRALVVQACEIVNSGAQPLGNLSVLQELEKRFGANQEQKNDWVVHWLSRALQALESFLKPHAGTYSFGDELTAADCFMIPHFVGCDRFGAEIKGFPTLTRIRTNLEKLEAVSKAHPKVQPDTPPAT